MNYEFVLSSVSVIATLTIFLFVLLKKSKTKLQKSTFGIIILMFTWSLLDFIRLIYKDAGILETTIWKIEYIAICLSGLSVLITAIIYSKNERILTKKNVVFILLPPFISIGFMLTNELHHLFFLSNMEGSSNRGPLFWFHTGFSYIYAIIALYLFISFGFKEGGLYKKYSLLFTVGAGGTFLSNILFLFIIKGNMDTTIYSFIMFSLVLIYVVFKYNFFDILPIALRTVFNNLNTGVIVVNANNLLIDTNYYAKTLLLDHANLSLSSNIAESVEKLSKSIPYYDNDKEKFDMILGKLEKQISFEFQLDNSIGQRKYLKLEAVPIIEKEAYVGKIFVLEDLTELKEAEIQLVQKEKMTSYSQMAAGLAHEINNPLGALQCNINLIDTYLKICLEKTKAEDKDKIITKLLESTKVSIISCERVDKLIKGIKGFVNLDEAEMKQINVNTSIDNTLIMLGSYITPNIEIIREYGDLPEMLCNPNEINHIFFNILKNSLQAIKEKGKVVITTSLENAIININIEDTGIGIDQKALKNIFEPTFAVKDGRVKAGMGLAYSSNVAKKYGGIIEIRSEKTKGTEVNIKINPSAMNEIEKRKGVLESRT